MNISPANVSIPAVVPSVNPPTEQVARENRVREKIVPPRQPNASAEEKPVTQEEKQLRKPSWDPSEHPDYTDVIKQNPRQFEGSGFAAHETLSQLSAMLSSGSYVPQNENGYAMRIKLPKEILDKIDELKASQRTGAVVAMRYQQSSAANLPSEVLIVI
ncbi:ATP-dependent Lon protease [Grimontia sp. NTOU-MAR1]|uniref:ATP-dependent Lon protease n=1 Tax=Grimontia sp. NTOU-MAR1 TaxID=3111011 RepID=UPI002DBF4CB7|nr:ATP-dependent Lon protease [Grimontia sp. NTOU-MAR1]WRV96801.1 ATP-dependent Lon protease [Grimontia sp. NTOU-MAR1]